jgi:hypothetical protein
VRPQAAPSPAVVVSFMASLFLTLHRTDCILLIDLLILYTRLGVPSFETRVSYIYLACPAESILQNTIAPQLKMRWTTYLAAAASVVEASTLTPPVLPLIVRNPYLSTWLGNAREAPWTRWPIFWTGQDVGFGVLVSVPRSDTVYPLLGRPHDSLPKTGERCVTRR